MLYYFLTGLSRRQKRGLMLILDLSLVLVSLYAAYALRFGTIFPYTQTTINWVIYPALAVVAAPLILFCQLPNVKLNAFENTAMLRIGACALSLALFASGVSYLFGLGTPRSVPLILAVTFFFSSVITKILGNAFLHLLQARSGDIIPVAIFGAGSAGIQLVSALRQSKEIRPVAIFDDNPSLHGLLVAGLKVENPSSLAAFSIKKGFKRVLVAIPSLSRTRQSELVHNLESLDLEVQVLPSYVDMLSADQNGDKLRTVSPDELLGRDKVDLDVPEIANTYAGRVVMVTGAGGSIGSELCRQLLECQVSQLVLFEQSELGLYNIDQELRPLAKALDIGVTTRLGSVTNRPRVRSVMQENSVEIVLHAAAYKHVPLVEENELEGARNNVLGTQTVVETAAECGVERFILISTDKAVRPTSVMGATKRMAELVVQDVQTRFPKTKISMVRFGNVLGSSGSVLPRFQAQIASGGPVTVTHRDITRYFMTIPEAARLVLLAGAFSNDGSVFVLDMGKPKKIIDIARRMIQLSGHRVKEAGASDDGIEIKITGLRPGEKLFEELLIDSNSLCGTPHKKILQAQEKKLSKIEVAGMLKDLHSALETGEVQVLRNMIESKIDGYHHQEEVA